MAGASLSPFKARFLLASSVLLLFTPPIFSMLIFFGPLIVSTVLGVLAVVSFGQHGGISTGQEEETSENSVAGLDLVVSSAASVEKISDVLMVGNQEVTWLEWLHNEDMEKCHSRDHVECRPARWDLDELDSEASVGSLASSVEEKSMVDAYGSVVSNESFVNEQDENASDMIGVSSTTIPYDGICVRTQVDKLTGQASPVSDVSGVNAFGCDVVRTNAPPLKVGGTKIEPAFTDEVSVLAIAAVKAKGICCDCTDTSGTCCRKALDWDINDEHVENTVERNHLDLAANNESDSGFPDGDGVQESIVGRALMVQGESRTTRACSLGVRDVTTTSRHSLEVAVENNASECTSVDADEGQSVLLSRTSKTLSGTDASEVSFPKEGVSFMLETEALGRHGMGLHIHEGVAKEGDFREDNGGPIHKGDAEKRRCRENNEGPISDVSGDEENKSSLRFSFFNNGCLTLTPVKDDAEGVALRM